MADNLIYITVVVLLPIIPAFILYKALPSRSRVSGPFKGLTIQLSGAFAGYFLVVLVMLGFVYTQLKPIGAQYEIWTIRGQIGFEQVAASANIRSIPLFIRPPNPIINEDGSFKMEILAKSEPTGVTDFPTLIIDYPGYVTANVDLNEKVAPFAKKYDKKYDKNTKEIRINEPVFLKKKEATAPFSPTGPVPRRTNLTEEVNP